MTYKVNQFQKTILDHLRNLYGRPTPNKKTHNKTMWAAQYNPSDPIEDLFDRPEECFVVALVAKPAYSTEKIVDRALITIQLTSLYSTAILEWNAIYEVNRWSRMVCWNWLTLYVIAPMPLSTYFYFLGTHSLSSVMIARFTFDCDMYMITLLSTIVG